MDEIDLEKFRDMGSDIGPAVVASSLAPQLGSDRADLMHGKTDMRRLTVLTGPEVPFLLYAKIRSEKSRVWGLIYEELLNLKVSIGGRGRRDIIRMEGVSKGGMAQVEAEIEKPGWLSRNITDREWRRRELERRGEM